MTDSTGLWEVLLYLGRGDPGEELLGGLLRAVLKFQVGLTQLVPAFRRSNQRGKQHGDENDRGDRQRAGAPFQSHFVGRIDPPRFPVGKLAGKGGAAHQQDGAGNEHQQVAHALVAQVNVESQQEAVRQQAVDRPPLAHHAPQQPGAGVPDEQADQKNEQAGIVDFGAAANSSRPTAHALEEGQDADVHQA